MNCPYCSGKEKAYWTRTVSGRIIHGIFGGRIAVHDSENLRVFK